MRHPDDNVEIDGEICGEPGCDCRRVPPEYRAEYPTLPPMPAGPWAEFDRQPIPLTPEVNRLHALIARSNRPWED